MGQPFHDRAIILSTGDEIITGQLQDTNARWLAQQLLDAGIMPIGHRAVPDELPALAEALRDACERVPLILMSGGLGPTDGDLTREALRELTGAALVADPDALQAIAAILARRGREMTERQARQAQRPASARCLRNAFGTAPGLHLCLRGNTDIIALPGPPGELRPMFHAHVRPLLRPPPGRTILTRLAHIVGIPEAECVARLGDLTRRDRNPLVGITASGGILTLRIRYEGPGDNAIATQAIDAAENTARAALGDHLFASAHGAATGLESLIRTVLGLLHQRGETLSVVESCTGGTLGELLSSVPGSSASFLGGAIVYANATKVELGVRTATLETHGAVSAECCHELCRSGLARHHASHTLAITGIAGPDGGSAGKPVGTVFIGHSARAAATASMADVRRFLFTGDREDIRRRACVSALAMLYFSLRGRAGGAPGLLWQVHR